MDETPFWEKPLGELDSLEWEALCDNCGRCCLFKLEDEDTGEVVYTEMACKLFDPTSCRCSDYQDRINIVPTCLQITPRVLRHADWLPVTCAYRRRFENKPLHNWHPLISGNENSVEEAGISVRNRVTPCEDMDTDELMQHIITWVR